jgi:hypothetical protein
MYDPHSAYFSADTLKDFSIQMKLSLIGIGAVLSLEDDGYCVVKEVKPGSPADLSGQIHMNDKIVAVQQAGGENIEVIGMKLRRIVDLIRGAKGTKVTLTILPHDAVDAGKTKVVHIVRDVIKLDEARAFASIYDLPGDFGTTVPVGVITLNSFYGPSEDSTGHGDQEHRHPGCGRTHRQTEGPGRQGPRRGPAPQRRRPPLRGRGPHRPFHRAGTGSCKCVTPSAVSKWTATTTQRSATTARWRC